MFQEFIKFLITSGIATIVNILARIALSIYMPYEVAVVIAHLIGMAVAYALARKYVFAHSGQNVSREITGFALVNVMSLTQVWLISVGLYRFGFPAIDWTYRPDLVAHLVGVGSLTFTSYFGHKYISFGAKN